MCSGPVFYFSFFATAVPKAAQVPSLMPQKRISSVFGRFNKLVLTDDAKLLDFAVRIAALAFLVDDIIEYRTLARSLRIFLPSPVLPIISSLPGWSDWLISALHIAGLVFLIWKPRLRPAAATVLAVTILQILGDLIRLQPFILMYGFTILMPLFPRLSNQARLQALRLMIVGVYFWAGFHKINSNFYLSVFPWFTFPLWGHEHGNKFIMVPLIFICLSAPIFELLIGVFLVFKRTRKLATLMAFILLVTILTCLGPFGHNVSFAVWPWNIYLFITEVVLFLAPHRPCTQTINENWPCRAAAAIFMFAPILGIWQVWDATVSFKLFAGNTDSALIVLDEKEDKQRLPPEVTATINHENRTHEQISKLFGLPVPAQGNAFSLADWLGRLDIAINPDVYVYRTGTRGLCPYLQYPNYAILRITYPEEFNSSKTTQTDEPLCP